MRRSGASVSEYARSKKTDGDSHAAQFRRDAYNSFSTEGIMAYAAAHFLSPTRGRQGLRTSLGGRLQSLREREGLSVEEASERIRVKPFLWRLIEADKYYPSDIFADAIATAFKCSLNWLNSGIQ